MARLHGRSVDGFLRASKSMPATAEWARILQWRLRWPIGSPSRRASYADKARGCSVSSSCCRRSICCRSSFMRRFTLERSTSVNGVVIRRYRSRLRRWAARSVHLTFVILSSAPVVRPRMRMPVWVLISGHRPAFEVRTPRPRRGDRFGTRRRAGTQEATCRLFQIWGQQPIGQRTFSMLTVVGLICISPKEIRTLRA
jgi:hypothetical protein